ncbi:MAG: hypothetical protein M3466_19665 [Gemmatimonadota bacterium]|nr:hypothetical protein [Gemmatimonadota bacterium]
MPAAPGAFEIVRAVDQLATRPLWPGFDPRQMPLAIYDGESTYLFRHPGPPPEFRELDTQPGTAVVTGRHPAVTANSTAQIAGLQTATLSNEPSSLSTNRRAAVAIHELFHVFQRTRHPGWSANEVDLFAYPFTNVRNLALRRLESHLMRRALVARSRLDVACWAAAAIDVRTERYRLLDSASVTYERRSELNEGLATYVQSQASGEQIVLPLNEFQAEDVRSRSYATGAAFASILDRLVPAWKDSLEQRDEQSLDEIAARIPRGEQGCAVEPRAAAAFDSSARADVRDLGVRMARSRAAFHAAPGWRIVVETESAPLFPRSFDTLNVARLTPSDVLHSRFIRVGNAAGSIEVFGQKSITEGIGSHPMFSGIRRLTVAGLSEEPVVGDSAGSVTIRAPGINAVFKAATIQRGEKVIGLKLHQ